MSESESGEHNPMKIVRETAVAETVLKKRRINEQEYQAKKVAAQLKKDERKKHKKSKSFKTPEKIIESTIDKINDARRLRRTAKTNRLRGLPNVDGKELVLIIRHRNAQGLSVPSKRILNKLHLTEQNSAVFARLDKELIRLLILVRPFVVYGKPSLKSITTLIKTRAFYLNDEKKREALKDNSIVEKKLGQYGIVCIDDIIHEIYTLGENFNEVIKFLAPFKLSYATGTFEKKILQKDNIGAGGDRGENIDELIDIML